MNNKQLPPLPTLQPGDSHMESLIEAAIQGHADTREAMRWLVRQLVPLQARAQVQGDPSWWMRETDEGAEWTDTAPLVLSGWTPLYTAPQPAQATQAEVTDEQIAACVKRASTYGLPFVGLLNPGGTPSDFSKRFTVEILALRPVQVPMTDGWINASERVPLEVDGEVFVRFTDGSIGTAWATYWHGASNAFAQWTHPDPDEDRTIAYWMKAPGITAQAKKETP